MATQPLLDLSTLIEGRPSIRIDGATYHLKSSEELSLLESQQFTSWGKELERLAASVDEAAEQALNELVNKVAWAALADVPRPVFDKLSGSQRMSVIEVFTALLLGRRLRLAGALIEQVTPRRTGANSSHGSSSPSAATPADGSAPSQLH